MCIYMCVYIYICICAYIYIYIYWFTLPYADAARGARQGVARIKSITCYAPRSRHR